jgi:glycosyltransferase involved in cell wall biosynthesis
LTASSSAIASAYVEKYGLHPIPIHNTFSLPRDLPNFSSSEKDGIRLYWFSQTIGPGRGLEDAVVGMGFAGIPGELHLRGRPHADYLQCLRRLAKDSAPLLKIVHHNPAPPDAMIELCADYDVGLSLEQTNVLNRALCLTNKAFTYMLAGRAVALTDTLGQRPQALELGEGAIVYKPGEVQSLAEALKRWAKDKEALRRAKMASWEAAKRRWHWDHPAERGMLLNLVAQVS